MIIQMSKRIVYYPASNYQATNLLSGSRLNSDNGTKCDMARRFDLRRHPRWTFRSIAMGRECSKNTAMPLESNARHTYAIFNRPGQDEVVYYLLQRQGRNLGDVFAAVQTVIAQKPEEIVRDRDDSNNIRGHGS